MRHVRRGNARLDVHRDTLARTAARGQAEPTVFYLSTRGNDRWSGRLAEPNAAATDGPLASLAAARDAVRKLKSRGPLQRPVDIRLRGGTYYLESGLVLAGEDSGTETCPVNYRAHGAEKPILCGGLRLTQWKPYRGEIFSSALPADRLGGTVPKRTLLPRRAAGAGAIPIAIQSTRGSAASCTWIGPCERTASGSSGARPACFPGAGRERRTWKSTSSPPPATSTASRRWPRSWTPSSGSLPPHSAPTRPAPVPGNRFFIRNALEELDAPGEWYYDQKSATIYFWPPDNQLRREGAVVPRIADLVVCRGDFDRKQFVRHVTFDHLGLECCHQDGIVLEAARHCQITGCTLSSIGRTAILLGEGDSACRVAGNDIAYPGGQAIATAPGVNTPKATADHLITNNYSHHCGEIWTCGVGWGSGIYLAGRHHTVSHNLVHNAPYSLINFTGWRHVIEYNHCHHGVLECFDGAGIYGWIDPTGGSGKNLVRCNRIHDIVGYGIPWIPSPKIPADLHTPCFAWGIYLDDKLSDTIVEGNLVYRAPGGILLHGCWNTRVENNIFAEASDEQI